MQRERAVNRGGDLDIARVIGVGDFTPQTGKKKPESQVGYAEVVMEGETSGQPSIEPLPNDQAADSQVGYGQVTQTGNSPLTHQAIEPLPESQTEIIDTPSPENVQEKILEALEALTEKRDRLLAQGDYINAGKVSDQINSLEAQFDTSPAAMEFGTRKSEATYEVGAKGWEDAVAQMRGTGTGMASWNDNTYQTFGEEHGQ